MSAPLIDIQNLTFEYPDGTLALRGVNLQILENQFIALIGQNGSGKTTLSKSLNGLLRPTSGKVMVGDIDTSQRGVVKKLVTRVGYVFQNPDHQLFNNSVYKEIAYGPRNLNLLEEEVGRRVEQAAVVAGVRKDLFESHPFFLTKGLRQRIAIASILAMQPKTIIVDEPTTGQDLRQSLDIMDFLERLWREQGHTIIIVTHEMSIVARYARRIIAMSNGQVLMDGSAREVFSRPNELLECGVRPPQATQLAHLLQDRGVPLDLLNAEEVRADLRARLEKKKRVAS